MRNEIFSSHFSFPNSFMDFQNIIVGIIFFAALVYVGLMIWNKAKLFKPTNLPCVDDCSCGTKSKSKI